MPVALRAGALLAFAAATVGGCRREIDLLPVEADGSVGEAGSGAAGGCSFDTCNDAGEAAAGSDASTGLDCPPTGECRACATDDDCNSKAPHCDPTEMRCIECKLNTDCLGFNRACNPATLQCAPACAADADCANQGSTRICHRTFCVECEDNNDCLHQARPVCAVYVCVPCTVEDNRCPSDRPICSRYQCVARH